MSDMGEWLRATMETYESPHLEPVRETPDFLRVKHLPRRDPENDVVLPGELRARLLRPGATLVLRPIQIRTLVELQTMRGAFCPINVGGGKTLICWAAPTVLQKRALYLTPAKLLPEARREREKYERAGLIVRDDVELRSYSFVSQAENACWLEEYAPELILADEAHSLRSMDAARTKRFCRYLDMHPHVQFVCLSGSMTKRSLQDYGHLAHYALRQRDASFLPNDARVTLTWAEAIDLNGPKRPAGVLREFCGPDENVRQGYRRRMVQTPGVVATTETEVPCPLVIRQVDLQGDDAIREAVSKCEQTWTRPDGEELSEAMEQAEVLRQLKLGGYYYWDWPGEPDVEWLEARRAWGRALRNFLAYKSRPGLDSPALVEQVLRAPSAHREHAWVVAPLVDTYFAWCSVRDRPAPPTKWKWVSLGTVQQVATWALRRKCIVWTSVVAFGQRLADELGTRYYGAGDDNIARENGHRTIVASIDAHGTGRNLQQFACSLICAGVPAGDTIEQLIGRTHRPGQQAKQVEVYYLKMFKEEMHSAVRDATYAQDTIGNKQKLNLASWPDGRP